MQVRYDAALGPVERLSSGRGWLTDGAVYEVIEVYRDNKRSSFRLEADNGTPALFDARSFSVVDDTMPADWRIQVEGDVVLLGTASFLNAGFWEDYFDREELASEIYRGRQPTAAWQGLSDADYRATWSRFEARYRFRASVEPGDWPGIEEPPGSVTFDLRPIFKQPGASFAAATDAINAEALRAFITILDDQAFYALDWQHPAYLFWPARHAQNPNPAWPVPVFPNGDYYAFLTSDFNTGTFGHPWERSLCIIGKPLIDTLGLTLRTWLPILRQR